MKENAGVLGPEDYAEPRCLLCGEPYGAEPRVKSIPQQRVIEKLDEYTSRRDTDGARRHLEYWLEEARLGKDERGELLVRNEMVGHFRKTGNREKAFESVREALRLVEKLGFDGSVSAGTTYVNAATAMNAFGENEKSLAYFEKAKAIYEAAPGVRADLLGGLYNNMALVLVSLGRYPEAHALYDKAMDLMGKVPGGELEQAITCLNRADAVAAQEGSEAGEKRICELVDRAWELIDSPAAPRNGYYAFVCEKCEPTFSHYGYFAAAEELKRRAEEIYERP